MLNVYFPCSAFKDPPASETARQEVSTLGTTTFVLISKRPTSSTRLSGVGLAEGRRRCGRGWRSCRGGKPSWRGGRPTFSLKKLPERMRTPAAIVSSSLLQRQARSGSPKRRVSSKITLVSWIQVIGVSFLFTCYLRAVVSLVAAVQSALTRFSLISLTLFP